MRRIRGSIAFAGMAFLLALVGCGDDDDPSEPDASVDATVDATADAMVEEDAPAGDADAMAPMDPDTPPLQTGSGLRGTMGEDIFYLDPAMAMPADFSCRGMNTAPTDGALIDFLLEIRDFQQNNPVSGACLKVYDDNVVPVTDSCDPAS
ncbi:MAG: hypothetical protein AAGF12_35475, partial [Myxococcota bacterium]